jgi:hypothetical protein
MHRRDFLKTGAQAAAVGAAVSASAGPGPAAASATGSTHAPSLLKSCTAGDHRRRLENIGLCQRSIRTCVR